MSSITSYKEALGSFKTSNVLSAFRLTGKVVVVTGLIVIPCKALQFLNEFFKEAPLELVSRFHKQL